jgi:hypothetical protein
LTKLGVLGTELQCDLHHVIYSLRALYEIGTNISMTCSLALWLRRSHLDKVIEAGKWPKAEPLAAGAHVSCTYPSPPPPTPHEHSTEEEWGSSTVCTFSVCIVCQDGIECVNRDE